MVGGPSQTPYYYFVKRLLFYLPYINFKQIFTYFQQMINEGISKKIYTK